MVWSLISIVKSAEKFLDNASRESSCLFFRNFDRKVSELGRTGAWNFIVDVKIWLMIQNCDTSIRPDLT